MENGPGVDIDTLEIIRQILEHASVFPRHLDGLAGEWLVRLNLEHSPTNLRLARNQVVLGKLLGVRSRIQDAKSPVSEVERALQALSLNFEVAAAMAEGWHQPSPAEPIPAAPNPLKLPATPPPPADRFAAITIKELAAAYLEAHPQCDVGQKGSIWTAKTPGQFEGALELSAKFLAVIYLANTVRTGHKHRARSQPDDRSLPPRVPQ